MATSMLRLNVLGPIRAAVDGEAVELSAGRKAWAMLAVLAAEPGRRAKRDRLAALLWSGRFEEQARQSLRQMLSALRRDLDAIAPGAVTIEREYVALADCVTDLDDFAAALAANDFAAAAALWRGEYAAELDIDVEAWAPWRDAVRARLRPRALAAFEATARAAASDGALLSAASQMLTLDPLNEVAVGMMLPVVARGQGAAAAAAIYDDFVARLRRERGRSPASETAAIYASALGSAAASPGPRRFAPAKAAAVCAFLAIAALFGAATFQFGRVERPAPSDAFIESAILRWPFRFAVGEPRALDRESSTLRVAETLAQDLRNALAVMPGSALAVTPAQTDFVLESDIRSGPDERLAINLRLVERASGRVIWADSVPGPERYAGGFPERQAASIETAIARAYAALLVEMDRRRPQMPAPAPEVAEAVRQGWQALRGGANRARVAESDAAFRRAFELDPESPDARIGMAHSLAMHLLNGWSERRAEDAALASRLIAETIERNARQPVAFFVQGLVHKSQRDYARGLAAMRVTLQIQPQHAASYAQSAHMLLLSGDAERAIEMAELAVLLGPDANALDRALLYAGMARFLVGDYPAAVRHLERAFAINRTFADVYAWYAAALYRAGGTDDAREVYRQMRARWPAHRIDHHVLISHLPQRMERFMSAIADLEARAQAEPASPVSAN